MFSRGLVVGLVLGVATLVAAQDPHNTVEIAPAKTSIYIGNVTMTMPTFKRTDARYKSTYAARVFPYFFYNEHGTLEINFTDEQLSRLDSGERVEFQGRAQSESGEARRIEGQATPTNKTSGKIKVRVFVTAKIELIFNTTYRFTQMLP